MILLDTPGPIRHRGGNRAGRPARGGRRIAGVGDQLLGGGDAPADRLLVAQARELAMLLLPSHSLRLKQNP